MIDISVHSSDIFEQAQVDRQQNNHQSRNRLRRSTGLRLLRARYVSEVDTYLTRSSSPSPKSWQPSTLTQPLATNSMKHMNNTKTTIARHDVQNHVTSLRASTVIRNPGQTVQQGTTSHQPTHAEPLNLANPRHTHETEIHCLEFPLLFRKTSLYRTKERNCQHVARISLVLAPAQVRQGLYRLVCIRLKLKRKRRSKEE